MKQPVDESIIQMARRGDQDAIGKLYGETKKYAYSIAWQYLRSDADVEDVLQEAYSSAFGKLDTFEEGMPFKPWFHKIVSNKCLDFIKSKKATFVSMDDITELAADGEEAFPAEWLEKAEKRRDIMRIIDALPEGHRMAIFLHYVEGLSIAKVADVMGISEGAVKNHLYHGRKAIKAGVLLEEKKGNKLYGLIPMPMLAKVFELEAESTVMPEALSKAVWEGVRKNLIENDIIKSTSATPNAGTHTTGTEDNSTNAGQQASNTGTKSIKSGSSPPGGGLNIPNWSTHTANAGAHAGAEAANKGGLIKMFLGLSTGKKIGVIAAALAVLMCLSLLASALAAPTLTPTPTPTFTPKPGANNPPNGSGGGGSSGGGTKPDDSDGPSGTGKPEASAPPKKETPPDEDNTPIEVEVDPDLDADIKPKKGRAKEYEKTAVWTISFKAATASGPSKYIPEYADAVHILTMIAVKKSGEGMLGSYSGPGFLECNADFSRTIAQVPEFVYTMISDWEGPLEGIAFELYAPSSDADEEELAPLVETLAPLVKPKYTGWAGSKMTWPVTAKQVHVDTAAGSKSVSATVPPIELTYYIYTYPGGRADLHLLSSLVADYLTFRGTISKKISWKQVK